jgi:hypothetical protein
MFKVSLSRLSAFVTMERGCVRQEELMVTSGFHAWGLGDAGTNLRG